MPTRDVPKRLESFSDSAEIPLRPAVQRYRLEDANRALRELKHEAVRGAKVLVIDEPEASSD